MPTIHNRHHNKIPKDAVYIGRPSKWGNPFVIGETDPINPRLLITRERAVELYAMQAMKPEAAKFREIARQELKGKDLVCWCAPHPCHGDVLLKIANGEDEDGRSN